jgi:hypothetical protein
VVAVIWLLLAVVAAVVVVALVVVALDNGQSPKNAASYQMRVELHDIRRRQEVSQVKTEIRRDAAKMRRQLRVELSELGKRKRRGL